MSNDLPLASLIETRLKELNLDRHALGFRLGYKNPAKAAGRVDALCSGYLTNRKSRAALARLPDALRLFPEVGSLTRHRFQEVGVSILGHGRTDHVRVLISRPGVDTAPDPSVAHLLCHL